jgi:hypothetical protein
MGKVRGHIEETVVAQRRPGAPDVVTAGAPLGEGDGGSVPSVRERLRSRDLAVKVFVAGATYVALVWINKAWAVIGAVLSPVVSDLVRDFVERHNWSLRRLRRGSAAAVLLGHEEAAYASGKRAGRRRPGGRIPGGLMTSAAAVALVTAAIAAGKVHDRVRAHAGPHQPGPHGHAGGPPNRGGGLHGVTPTGGPPSLHGGHTPGIVLSGVSPTTEPPVVRWNTVPGADGYVVYRDGRRIDTPSDTETSYTDRHVGAGKYTYQVAWIDAGVVSQRSKPLAIAYRPVAQRGLEAPTGLVGTTPTTEPPSLTWDLVEGATSYDVYRDGKLVGPQTTPPFNDTDAVIGRHVYVVVARAGDTASDRSAPYTIEYVVLPAPTGVHSTSKITQLPAFAWDAVPGALGYVVYREGVPLPQVTGTSYQEPDVSQPPVSYTYYVRAVNHVGVQGDASESVTIAYNPYPVVS